MDVLLAPVYESFLAVRKQCLAEGGFVVGPIGVGTAEALFTFAIEAGVRDKTAHSRFIFDPWLAGVVYESHPETGEGGLRYMGLIDEIEINEDNHAYRFPKMKPGEGHHGETKYDERMPAFVRFKILKPVSEVMPGHAQLWPKEVGLSESILRHFKINSVRKTAVAHAFEAMRAAAAMHAKR